MLLLSIKSSIRDAWVTLLLNLCQPIYKLINSLYNLFITVGTASILNSDSINKVYNRVGMLLGLYMLFRVTFSFVQLLINPDLVSDKEKGVGNILKKVILVIALLGFMPTVFIKAMELQNLIVGINDGQNIIAKLILPETRSNTNKFGAELSAYLFSSFYIYNDDLENEDESEKTCNILNDTTEGNTALFNSIVQNEGSISSAFTCIDKKFPSYKPEEEQDYQISFEIYGVFAVIVGIIVCWILLLYVINVGVRVIQMAFLRLVSPLAIMSYLSPKKDTMFEKWGKMCITTYIDLFIRMAIIYFIVYLISILMSETGLELVSDNSDIKLVYIVMIVALLFFAKKAPELVKELFPQSGAASLGFGIKSPKSFAKELNELPGANIAKRAYGAATVGFLTNQKNLRKGIGKTFDSFREGKIKEGFKWAARSTFGSAYSTLLGMKRGVMTTDKSGRKNAYTNAYDRTQANYKLKDAGYGIKEKIPDAVRGFFGRDQVIGDMADASDRNLEALRNRLMYEHQNSQILSDEFSISKNKRTKKYIVKDPNGKEQVFNNSNDVKMYFGSLGYSVLEQNKFVKIADLGADIGKETSDNKALHQKDNEKKKDNN